jgi:hypothetical protein
VVEPNRLSTYLERIEEESHQVDSSKFVVRLDGGPVVLPKIFLQILQKSVGSSLRRFLEQPSFTKLSWSENNTLPYPKFADAYENFCIENGLDEEMVDSVLGVAILADFFLKVEPSSGSDCLGLCNIRWVVNDSLRPMPSNPTATSLDKFIRERCVLSNHAADFIMFHDFQDTYISWCNERGYSIELLTPSVFQKQFGVVQRSLPARQLSRLSQQQSQRSIVERLFSVGIVPEFFLNSMKKWWWRETFYSFIHATILIFSPMAFIIPGFITEYLFSISFAINHTSTIFSPATNLQYMLWVYPWQIVFEPHSHISGIVYIVMCIWFILDVEIILHFWVDPIEEGLTRILLPSTWQQGRPKWWLGPRRLFHQFSFAVSVICLVSWFAYCFLVLVWFILAACIKPELYLPYATASFAFITFAFSKGNDLSSMQQMVKKAILDATKTELGEYLSDSQSVAVNSAANSFLSGLSSSVANAEVVDSATAIVKRTIDQSKELSSALENVAGVEPMTLALLMAFNDESAEEVARQFGIKYHVLKLVIAACHRNEELVLKHFQLICDDRNVQCDTAHVNALVAAVKASVKVCEDPTDDSKQGHLEIVMRDVFDAFFRYEQAKDVLNRSNLDQSSFSSVRQYQVFVGRVFNLIIGLASSRQQCIQEFVMLLRDLCARVPEGGIAVICALIKGLSGIDVDESLDIIGGGDFVPTDCRELIQALAGPNPIFAYVLQRWHGIHFSTLRKLKSTEVLNQFIRPRRFAELKMFVEEMGPASDPRKEFPSALDAFIDSISDPEVGEPRPTKLDEWRAKRRHPGELCIPAKKSARLFCINDHLNTGVRERICKHDGICYYNHWSCCGAVDNILICRNISSGMYILGWGFLPAID